MAMAGYCCCGCREDGLEPSFDEGRRTTTAGAGGECAAESITGGTAAPATNPTVSAAAAAPAAEVAPSFAEVGRCVAEIGRPIAAEVGLDAEVGRRASAARAEEGGGDTEGAGGEVTSEVA